MTETNEREWLEEYVTEKTYIFKVKKWYPWDTVQIAVSYDPAFKHWYWKIKRIWDTKVDITIATGESESSIRYSIENKMRWLFNIEWPMLEQRINDLEKEKQSLKNWWDESEAKILEWIDKCTKKTEKIKELEEENKLLKYTVKIAWEQLSGKANVKVKKLIVQDKEIRL